MGFFAQGALIEQLATTTTSGGTTALTSSSVTWQRFDGSADQTVTLPDATTLLLGRSFKIVNRSSGTLTINLDGGSTLSYISPGSERRFDLFDNGTADGDWSADSQIDLDVPLNLFASRPSPNSRLNVKSNQVLTSEGMLLSAPPVNDALEVITDQYFDFATGSASGDVQLDGGLWTPPASTASFFRRMVLVYVSSASGTVINTSFSAEAATQGALPDADTLFSTLDGLPIGSIDLQEDSGAGGSQYRTPGSSAGIIDNAEIIKFSVGSGGGGAGGDTSFKLQSISSNVATIKKGSIILDDGRELATKSSGTLLADISINLKTEVNTVGVVAPAASTQYYLYLDLDTLPLSPETLSGKADRLLYAISKGTSGQFIVLAVAPEDANLNRYIPISALKTDGSSDYTEFSDLARRRHTIPSIVVNPLVETLGPLAIGAVGTAGNYAGGHVLDADSVPVAVDNTTGSIYNLADATDSLGSRDLTNNNAAVFTSTGVRGVAASAVSLDGVDQNLSSADVLFDFTTTMTLAGWFKPADLTQQTFISKWNSSGNQRSYRLSIDGNGLFEFLISNDGTAVETFIAQVLLVADEWVHIAVVYDGNLGLVKMYINGLLVISSITGIASLFASSADFNIGSQDNASNYLEGEVDEVLATSVTLTDSDIAKLASVIVTLSDTSVSPNNQLWSATYLNADSQIVNELNPSWLVHKRRDLVYALFSKNSGDSVLLKKFDTALAVRTTPAKGFNRTYTSDPSGTFAHGLPDRPTVVQIWHDSLGNGQYDLIGPSGYVKTTATDLIVDVSALTIDASHPVQIVATYGAGSFVVSKPALENFSPDFVFINSAYSAQHGDDLIADSSGGVFDVTLPASPAVGTRITLRDPYYDDGGANFANSWAVNNVTVLRNGKLINGDADDLDLDVPGGKVELVFTGDTLGWRSY